MDKRLQKRHTRQIARARERVKVSEPDLRTPEQVRADREASRPSTGWSSGASLAPASSVSRGHAASATGSAAKADV
jgi:hypothetical protein